MVFQVKSARLIQSKHIYKCQFMGNCNQYQYAGINTTDAFVFDDQEIDEISRESKWMRVCLCSTFILLLSGVVLGICDSITVLRPEEMLWSS